MPIVANYRLQRNDFITLNEHYQGEFNAPEILQISRGRLPSRKKIVIVCHK